MGRRDRSLIMSDRAIFLAAGLFLPLRVLEPRFGYAATGRIEDRSQGFARGDRSVVCPSLLLNSVALAGMASDRHFLDRLTRDGDLGVNACSKEYNFD